MLIRALLCIMFIWMTCIPWQVASDVSIIEEIVVTARKREEPDRSVPVALTVLSDFDLSNQSMRDLADVPFHTPNLQIKPFPAVNADANLSMRGHSQFEPIITMDPPVALYLDDVYLGRSSASLLNLVDLERIEVLQGPQGTLFGRNTTGGVVHLFTKRYQGEGLSGYLDLITGNRNRRDASGAISLPLIKDKLGVRMSFRSASFDGHNRNILLGEGLDDENAQTFRMNLSSRLSDKWELHLSYDKTRQREHSALFRLDHIEPAVLQPSCMEKKYPEIGCLINVLITHGNWRDALELDDRTVRSDVSSRHDVDVWGSSATINGSVNGLVIKSVTAYRELSRRNINDIDGTQWEILHPDADARQRQFSQELQLSKAGLDGLVEWTAGAFYFDESGEDKTTVIGIPALNPWSPSVIMPKGANRSMAGYAHFIFRANPETNVNAGFRYTYEKRKLAVRQENAGGCTLAFVNWPPCTTKVSKSFGGWSYTLSVDHHLAANRMVFASLSRGFKSGGFNGRASEEAEFEPFDPEIVDSLDIGFKSSWLERGVRLDVAGFYSKYRDIQRTQLVALSPTEIGTTIANAAKATVFGAEVQADAQLTPRWAFRLTAGLMIADYRKFTGLNGAGIPVDKSDLEFPNTPRHNYSVLVRYSLPVALGASPAEISLQADYAWQSKTYNDVENTNIDQPSYGLLNLRASMLLRPWDIEVALYSRNVINETYITGGLDFTNQFGYRGTFIGPARSINLQFTWNFH